MLLEELAPALILLKNLISVLFVRSFTTLIFLDVVGRTPLLVDGKGDAVGRRLRGLIRLFRGDSFFGCGTGSTHKLLIRLYIKEFCETSAVYRHTQWIVR